MQTYKVALTPTSVPQTGTGGTSPLMHRQSPLLGLQCRSWLLLNGDCWEGTVSTLHIVLRWSSWSPRPPLSHPQPSSREPLLTGEPGLGGPENVGRGSTAVRSVYLRWKQEETSPSLGPTQGSPWFKCVTPFYSRAPSAATPSCPLSGGNKTWRGHSAPGTGGRGWGGLFAHLPLEVEWPPRWVRAVLLMSLARLTLESRETRRTPCSSHGLLGACALVLRCPGRRRAQEAAAWERPGRAMAVLALCPLSEASRTPSLARPGPSRASSCHAPQNKESGS